MTLALATARTIAESTLVAAAERGVARPCVAVLTAAGLIADTSA